MEEKEKFCSSCPQPNYNEDILFDLLKDRAQGFLTKMNERKTIIEEQPVDTPEPDIMPLKP